MRRMGGMRRIAAVVAAPVALASIAGCSRAATPQYDVGPPLARALRGDRARHPAEARRRREAAQRQAGGTGGGPYFVSAEIHLEDDERTTRATSSPGPRTTSTAREFFSVDVHAREESSWPPADVRRHRRRRHRVPSVHRPQHRQDQGTDPVRAGRGVRRGVHCRRARTATTYDAPTTRRHATRTGASGKHRQQA